MENKNIKPQGQVSRSRFDRASSWLLSKIKGSPVGKLLTCYDRINNKFRDRIKAIKKRNTKTEKKFEAKRKIARVFERSFFVNKVPVLMRHLLRTSVRDYGVAFFTMGFIMLMMYPIQGFIDFVSVSFSTFIIGIAVCIILALFFMHRQANSRTLKIYNRQKPPFKQRAVTRLYYHLL